MPKTTSPDDRQAPKRLPLHPKVDAFADLVDVQLDRLPPVRGRQEQGVGVDQAPVQPLHRFFRIELLEQPLDRIAELLGEAGHRLVNIDQRPSEFFRERPVRGKAEDGGGQAVAPVPFLQKAKILLDQPSDQIERRCALHGHAQARVSLDHHARLDQVAIAGMTFEIIEQQRQEFSLSGLGPRQGCQNIVRPLVQELAPHPHLMLKVLAEFQPVGGIERLDRHGVAGGWFHERAIERHASMLSSSCDGRKRMLT